MNNVYRMKPFTLFEYYWLDEIILLSRGHFFDNNIDLSIKQKIFVLLLTPTIHVPVTEVPGISIIRSVEV